MSYCRFGWGGSDVYVFANVSGGIECCGCALGSAAKTAAYPNTGNHSETASLMVEHLMEHRAAGHVVPQDALDDLRREALAKVELWEDLYPERQ